MKNATLTRTVFDGLGKHLCPSRRLIPLLARTRHWPRRPDTTQWTTTSDVPVRTFHTPPLDTERAPLREAVWDFQQQQGGRNTPAKYSDEGSSHSAPEDLQTLYWKLNVEAAKGNVQGTREIVERLLKQHAEVPNLRLYSALILSQVGPEGSVAWVKAYLEELKAEGLEVDSGLCHDILKVLAVHPDYLLRAEILAYMESKWFAVSDDGHHDIVTGYLRDRQHEMALEKLDAMRSEGIRIQSWLYDVAMYYFSDSGDLDEALRLLKQRVADCDPLISGSMWFYLLNCASTTLHHELAAYIWTLRVQPRYLNPPSATCLGVLNAASRAGNTAIATDIFRVLAERHTIIEPAHYELLSEAYINAGDLRNAVSVLAVMHEARLPVTDLNTRGIYTYLQASPSRPADLFALCQALSKEGTTLPPAALNLCIEAAIHHGALDQALGFYEQFRALVPAGPNTSTFNALLRGCTRVHPPRKDLALQLAAELASMGLRPDGLTYERMLYACLSAPDYGDAVRYYDEMRSQGLVPRPGAYSALVRRLGVEGDKRAWEVLDDAEGVESLLNVERLRMWLAGQMGGKRGWGGG
ncbi:hypothetical protein EJ06DRAFT_507871 [Trichodelitschia bisporula]|uniref:Pentatricopeptide repeat-containing protein-mitochondrial domain-containing protein n=1 Tax=Trichodelitschia bisporula TaxID=703511 RepID=A0A6G1I0D7_9PEZI|nr:hypothetical protein EJ06DRAFT_507871 [Trichodelitschia bisporula]